MALTKRTTGLSSGIDKDGPDYTVYSGALGCRPHLQTRGSPNRLPWFWSFTVNCPMTRFRSCVNFGRFEKNEPHGNRVSYSFYWAGPSWIRAAAVFPRTARRRELPARDAD